MKGRRDLYRMEHAYSMLDMKVTGLRVRGVSTTYTSTVGSVAASMSVMMVPDADHVKTSIWPGVSMKMCLRARGGGQRGEAAQRTVSRCCH